MHEYRLYHTSSSYCSWKCSAFDIALKRQTYLLRVLIPGSVVCIVGRETVLMPDGSRMKMEGFRAMGLYVQVK